MSEKIELDKLKEPFSLFDVEWRIQSAGKTGAGKEWAICLVYVTNRAIMERLDEVCGPENWKNDYKPAPDGGILCGISIRIGAEWVTKWDGSDNTAVEAVKGGLSSAMKRAGVQWGLGRYLYKVKENFAKISPDGEHRGSYKDKQTNKFTSFKWTPPQLPEWALPKGEQGGKGGNKPVGQTTVEGVTIAIKGAKTLTALMEIWKNNWEFIKLLSEEQLNELTVAKDMRKANIEGGE